MASHLRLSRRCSDRSEFLDFLIGDVPKVAYALGSHHRLPLPDEERGTTLKDTLSRSGTCPAVFLIAVLVGMPEANAQDNQADRTILGQLNQIPPADTIDKAAEGLAREGHHEILTWERAYALALVRFRDKRTALATTLDPKVLDEDARRFEVGDFARFRKDFLTEGPGAFPDPSAHFFDLLARKQAVDNAIGNLALSENLLKLFRELIQGEASGLSQIDVDQIDQRVQDARINLIERRSRYRDRFDEFKVELGLSPIAPLVLDRSELVPFRDRFEELIRWSGDSSQDLEKLDGIVARLPRFGEVRVGNEETSRLFQDPNRPEDVIMAAIRAVSGNRGQADVQWELRVRQSTRRLVDLFPAYALERRKLVLSFRQQSTAFEQLIAPPAGQASRSNGGATKLAELRAQIREGEDRLVELWTASQSLRLSLYRDLGILPANDWKTFHDDLHPTIGDNKPARPAPPGSPLPPPAPGSRPGAR